MHRARSGALPCWALLAEFSRGSGRVLPDTFSPIVEEFGENLFQRAAGRPASGVPQSLGIADPGVGRPPARLVPFDLGRDLRQGRQGVEQGADSGARATGDIVDPSRDLRIQQPKIRVDDVFDVEEIADTVEIAYPHEGAGPGLDLGNLSREIRRNEIERLAWPGVIEGSHGDHVQALLGGFAAQFLGRGLGGRVGTHGCEGFVFAERRAAGLEGRVLLSRSHQEEARSGCVGLEGLDEIFRAPDVDASGQIRVFGCCGDERNRRQMGCGFGGEALNKVCDRSRVTDVHGVEIEPRHHVAGRFEAGNEPSPHESAGAGDQYPHRAAAFHRNPRGANPQRPRLLISSANGGSMIIGLSGRNGAGKGAIVEYLAERSFYVYSLSDVIRDELASRGVEETRERMIEAGRELRTAGGPGALAEGLIPKLLPDRNYVIDSIRHPAEVEALQNFSAEFRLVWVNASESRRLERMLERGRSGDPRNLDELRDLEGRELSNPDSAGQQLLAVEEMADFVIENEGGFDELHVAVREVFRESLFFERPSWDRYFMSIAQVVASRSNCVKRKVAAVVTRDRRIVSTGYNGTPRGTRNCNEGGCPRCNDLAPGGTGLLDCLCSHGEENAITQASYHGVSLQNATLYTTFSPCLQCTKMIINAGLNEVVYNASYPLGDRALELLDEAGVKLRQVDLSD